MWTPSFVFFGLPSKPLVVPISQAAVTRERDASVYIEFED